MGRRVAPVIMMATGAEFARLEELIDLRAADAQMLSDLRYAIEQLVVHDLPPRGPGLRLQKELTSSHAITTIQTSSRMFLTNQDWRLDTPGPRRYAAALVEAINETQAQREAAQVELQYTAAPDAMSSEDIYALIKSLGEIAPLLNHADPALLAQLYEALRLEMTYDAEAKTVSVTIRPRRRASERVRGGT